MRRPKDWGKLKCRLPRLLLKNQSKISVNAGESRERLLFNTMKQLTTLLLTIVCIIVPFSLISCEANNEENLPEITDTPENSKTRIIANTWYCEYISDAITSYDLLCFKKDGTFTRYDVWRIGTSKVEKVTESGTYRIDGEKIHLNIENSSDSGNFVIKNDVLRLSCKKTKFNKKFYKSSLKNLDNIVVGRSYMEMDPVEDVVEKSPYLNFMYGWYSGTHCYVELTKVEMQCKHGFNGESNFQYLRFCGKNGNVSPNGALVVHSRPSFEGIDKYWRDGTYKIKRGGGYYSYAMHSYFNGKMYTEDEGTLTIKSNGKYKVIDYKSDYLRIHFEGTFQN